MTLEEMIEGLSEFILDMKGLEHGDAVLLGCVKEKLVEMGRIEECEWIPKATDALDPEEFERLTREYAELDFKIGHRKKWVLQELQPKLPRLFGFVRSLQGVVIERLEEKHQLESQLNREIGRVEEFRERIESLKARLNTESNINETRRKRVQDLEAQVESKSFAEDCHSEAYEELEQLSSEYKSTVTAKPEHQKEWARKELYPKLPRIFTAIRNLRTDYSKIKSLLDAEKEINKTRQKRVKDTLNNNQDVLRKKVRILKGVLRSLLELEDGVDDE